jgi:DNA-binding transcriptional regulator LsrR (DeoR family)
VLGALRGGYVKTLITDSACADEVIAIMENDNRGALRLG